MFHAMVTIKRISFKINIVVKKQINGGFVWSVLLSKTSFVIAEALTTLDLFNSLCWRGNLGFCLNCAN